MLDSGDSYADSFPAVAESVPHARAALTEFVIAAGASGERLDAIRLAASEAITNAVMHAYVGQALDGELRTIGVNASFVEGDVSILVADEGAGLRHDARSRGLGLGLVLIAQLADEFQIVSRGTGGTELRMRFKLHPSKPAAHAQDRGSLATASSPA